MFLKAKLNPFYTFGKGQYLSFLNVDNLKSISRRKLKSYQKRFESDLGWKNINRMSFESELIKTSRLKNLLSSTWKNILRN
jgi:hypothetical protein